MLQEECLVLQSIRQGGICLRLTKKVTFRPMKAEGKSSICTPEKVRQ